MSEMEPHRVSKVEETEVSVVAYDSGWAEDFEEEKVRLQPLLPGAVDIQHFGSTAVPGLAAKPIIDILVAVGSPGPPDQGTIEALASEGYESLGEDGRRPGRWFFRKRGDKHFNLSLVPADGELWSRNLLFRDYLRSHPDAVEAYSRIKYEAAALFSTSLLGYQDHKRAFVQELVEQASASMGRAD